MQQINLYLPEFRPRGDWLAAENCAALLVVLLVALIGLQWIRSAGLRDLEEQVVQLETRQKTMKEQIAALKKTPAAGRSAALEREIAQTREAIRNREAIAEFIGGQSLGNQQGFSRHMLALGQHRVEGVALQAFAFYQGGSFARLAGVSQKPESVPLYVTQLQNDPNFAATKFGFLSMQNIGDGVQFLLSGNGPMAEQTLNLFAEKALQP